MNEHVTTTAEDSGLYPVLEGDSRPIAAAEEHHGVATTLGDLVMALQDLTEDDQLVLAVVSDLMRRGALKRPDTGSVH